MQLIEPSYKIIYCPQYQQALDIVETAIRLCKKSKESLDKEDQERLIRSIIKMGHLSTLEHVSITAHLVTGRSTTHELVRHRLASYTQESTRFCNYSGDKHNNEIQVIRPCWFTRVDWDWYLANRDNLSASITRDNIADKELIYAIERWHQCMIDCEHAYLTLTKEGEYNKQLHAQYARGVLPTDLKTEIIVSANIREWRHIFSLRVIGTTGPPHPDINKELLHPLFVDLCEKLPVFFRDLIPDNAGKV
jgi:thymidylate synthase (FAD)